MRVTIQIDDQDVSVSQSGADEQSPSAPTVSSGEPPAELAARAEALGVISAGSAPVQAPGETDPGAPGITMPSPEPGATARRETDALPAGAAPGQLDQTVSIEAIEEE